MVCLLFVMVLVAHVIFCCLLFYYVVKRYVACFHSVVRMFNCNCKVCFKMWGYSLKLYFDCKLQA